MTYVVAAIDENHNGDLQTAQRLVEAALAAKADAVKFRVRTPERSGTGRLLAQPEFRYPNLARTRGGLIKALSLSVADLTSLAADIAGQLDLVLAPHDMLAFDVAAGLEPRFLYVEPACIGHLQLLQAVKDSGRPAFAAIRDYTEPELERLVQTIDGDRLTLLNVVEPQEVDNDVFTGVAEMRWLARFGLPVGHRDTFVDETVTLVAVAAGAKVVEKRLTLDRSSEGPQHARSLLPGELARLTTRLRALSATPSTLQRARSLARSSYDLDERPSLVAACAIQRGQIITDEMIDVKPPAKGLSPSMREWVCGRRALYSLEPDDHITFGMVGEP